MLDVAIAITAEAFQGKFDKGGKPYILHCLHVMNKLKYEDDDELMQAAVMHDLIEDTDWTLDKLRELRFSDRVIHIITMLTHVDGEEYMEYIGYIGEDVDATKIKIQDLRHNSDLFRIKGVRERDIKRIEKYQKAYIYLKDRVRIDEY
jgi:(p)ppGpp synthase/HD superfamily hydrolase